MRSTRTLETLVLAGATLLACGQPGGDRALIVGIDGATMRVIRPLMEEGRLLSQTTGNNTEAVLNFVTKLDSDFLIKGYRSLMHSLYEPDAYYQRIKSYLSRYRHVGRREYLGVAGIKAFLRSLWCLGVRYPGRLAYWRFLLHTLVRYPREFGQAVALAIYGHHFRMVAADL